MPFFSQRPQTAPVSSLSAYDQNLDLLGVGGEGGRENCSEKLVGEHCSSNQSILSHQDHQGGMFFTCHFCLDSFSMKTIRLLLSLTKCFKLQ